MAHHLITILLAFLEGMALILSPCILPILPLVLAGSLTQSKKRPLGIVTGFALTFAVFSYFAHDLVRHLGFDLNLIRHAAYMLLLILGLILISNYLSELFARLTQKISSLSASLSTAKKPSDGFFSGVFFGSILSLIWTPCAGPILAAVIVQIAIQKESLISFFTLLSFALGAGAPMLAIAFYGLKLREHLSFFKKNALLIRQVLGLIILINVAYLMYQESSYNSSTVISTKADIKTSNYLRNALWHPYAAPKIERIDSWINSPPLDIQNLKGKVVLIDFWTYSCINCLRSLPYLNYWYKTYHEKGLVIIGVHSPEFDFEAKLNNVSHAVQQNQIQYPVALDNEFATWTNFSNHYWPAHYLINKEGKVVYEHFGEGEYDVVENNIRFLLGKEYSSNTGDFGRPALTYGTTPETYLGYMRANNTLSPNLIHDKSATYGYPKELVSDGWALQGDWEVQADKIVSAKAHASIKIHFNAKKVYMVMGNASQLPLTAIIRLNSKPLKMNQGKDIHQSTITVDKHTLYEIVALPESESAVLEIISSGTGLEIYTFTFGS